MFKLEYLHLMWNKSSILSIIWVFAVLFNLKKYTVVGFQQKNT